ncbi:hypothetical protein ACF1BE_32940 [Streptomyces sp. NPDC014991]|uniref:hypothetical protein n=1 Tax=Streptomyces sp. NPDC014991 TaxID=3364935 RepID=UPI0036F8AA91
MAKRGRTSQRQRTAGEAARRAAAAVRLAQLPPPQRVASSAVVQVPVHARQAGWNGTHGVSQVSVCASDCHDCAEARERFAAIRAESVVQRNRFDEPARYPYAAGKHTLHRVGCREVEQSVGQVKGDDSTWMHGALTRFAHEGTTDSGWATHMRVMDSRQAAAWVTERIGPRGGVRYRLCRICAPALPTAE